MMKRRDTYSSHFLIGEVIPVCLTLHFMNNKIIHLHISQDGSEEGESEAEEEEDTEEGEEDSEDEDDEEMCLPGMDGKEEVLICLHI